LSINSWKEWVVVNFKAKTIDRILHVLRNWAHTSQHALVNRMRQAQFPCMQLKSLYLQVLNYKWVRKNFIEEDILEERTDMRGHISHLLILGSAIEKRNELGSDAFCQ
jgi:hypothetical protein